MLAGVVGARLYHVVTDWERFENDLGDIPKIWEGGLGIPGGIALGVLVGVWLIRRRGIPAGPALTAVAPALPLAQAIGRFGNWFNQELYGRATDLPWALEIDDENLPPGVASGTTFHPTFLYESLWNLALCGALLWIDRRFAPQRGRLFAMYVAGYGLGRFWIEGLRIDDAKEFGPFRLNQWMALALIAGGLIYLLLTRTRRRSRTRTRDSECEESRVSGEAGAGSGVEDVDAVEAGDEGETVALGGVTETLGASDDLTGGGVVDVDRAVEERLGTELLDDDDGDVQPT